MRRPWLDDLPEPPALPPGYTLRAYRSDDLPALATLLTRAFGDPWDEERVRRVLVEAPDVEETYLIAHQDRLVATASARVMPDVYPGSGYLHWVGTDPEHQGKGLGTLVSIRVLHHFRDAGLRDAVLETQTNRVRAVRTYLRLGFVPEYHYGDPGEQLRWAQVLTRVVR
jgi:mycothiol synthase